MKKLISFIVIVLLMICCTESNKGNAGEEKSKNDWKAKKLKGRVKATTENTYNTELTGSLDDVLAGKGEIKRGNKMIKGITTTFDESGSVIEEAGIEEISNPINGSVIKSQNKNTFTYKYDEAGNRVEQSIYHADGTLWFTRYYKYDDKGNQTEFTPDEKASEKNLYEYDDKGNLIEDTRILNGKQWSKTVFKYDIKGNMIEMASYSDIEKGTLGDRTIYKYDDEGNQVEAVSQSAEGRVFMKYTYTYDYDKKKNWIKKIDFVNDKPNSITERELKYF